jgi:hypothetical protein
MIFKKVQNEQAARELMQGTGGSRVTIKAHLLDIVDKLGTPSLVGSGDNKVQATWVLHEVDETSAGSTVITIYDYKESCPLHEIKEWHVGGKGLTSEKIAELLKLNIGIGDVVLTPSPTEKKEEPGLTAEMKMKVGQAIFKNYLAFQSAARNGFDELKSDDDGYGDAVVNTLGAIETTEELSPAQSQEAIEIIENEASRIYYATIRDLANEKSFPTLK